MYEVELKGYNIRIPYERMVIEMCDCMDIVEGIVFECPQWFNYSETGEVIIDDDAIGVLLDYPEIIEALEEGCEDLIEQEKERLKSMQDAIDEGYALWQSQCH